MKKAIAVIVFLVLLIGIYQAADRVLGTKADDAIGPVEKYYALPKDSVDVLFVGASHVGMNVDNGILWDDYGIASYSMWGGMQPLWNSYYFVKEALKYQTPKVVMVEVFLAGTDVDYSTQAVAMKNIHALHFSLDKVQAALASFSTWQQAAEALWGMPYYHNRFDELTESDLDFGLYTTDMSVNRIKLPSEKVTQVNPLNYAAIDGELPLSPKNQDYLYRIMNLCRSKGVELVFLIAPYEATETETQKLNTLCSLAAANGVRTLNYLRAWDSLDLDTSVDFYDIGHLSRPGIAKLTASVGAYLHENFELPDRRNDPKHIWNNASAQAQEKQAAFKLEKQFMGDGAKRMIDTGVKLYENRYGSWTILTKVDMTTVGDGGVYLSCFSEEAEKGYFGLLLRKTRDNTLTLILGNNIDVILPEYSGDTVTLGIVKEQEAYTVYMNGEREFYRRELPCAPYSGHLLVGCQELTTNGEKFRHSQTHIMNLEVYNEALSEDRVLAWNPDELPMMDLPMGQGLAQPESVYVMPEQFMGDPDGFVQGAYIDTGLKLYEEPGACFTLLAEVLPVADPGNAVYFSDFAEQLSNYRGLLVRQLSDGQINIVFGNNNGVNVPAPVGKPVRLAFVKNIDRYTIYADGVKVVEDQPAPVNPYLGTLLIGAQQDENGGIFRQSKTRVTSLNVFAGCMTEREVLAWSYPNAVEPAVRMPASVNYTLPSAFLGNGMDRCIDTGIQLYEMADKDWTLDATLSVTSGVNNGVYMSCFSEDMTEYRGLLIRQDSDSTMNVYVGRTMNTPIDIGNARTLHLVIVKQGSHYTICCNGEMAAEVDSECSGYDGTLLIGAQTDAEGSIFRYSTGAVEKLKLEDGAITNDDAIQRSKPVKEGRF